MPTVAFVLLSSMALARPSTVTVSPTPAILRSGLIVTSPAAWTRMSFHSTAWKPLSSALTT